MLTSTDEQLAASVRPPSHSKADEVSMTKLDQQRRQVPRAAVSLRARWRVASEQYEARVTSLSLHGCLIQSAVQPSRGEIINLEIEAPGAEWLAIEGEVIYQEAGNSFGVFFVAPDEATRNSLASLIDHHLTVE
jgi:hypothetical protein